MEVRPLSGGRTGYWDDVMTQSGAMHQGVYSHSPFVHVLILPDGHQDDTTLPPDKTHFHRRIVVVSPLSATPSSTDYTLR